MPRGRSYRPSVTRTPASSSAQTGASSRCCYIRRMSTDLRTVLRIRATATAAASEGRQITPDLGDEMASAYERLRQDARDLFKRAGWGDDAAFDREVPPITVTRAIVPLPLGMAGHASGRDAIARGERAQFLLSQLAAWADSHRDAFEVEARLKAEAEAKAAPKSTVGFSG